MATGPNVTVIDQVSAVFGAVGTACRPVGSTALVGLLPAYRPVLASPPSRPMGSLVVQPPVEGSYWRSRFVTSPVAMSACPPAKPFQGCAEGLVWLATWPYASVMTWSTTALLLFTVSRGVPRLSGRVQVVAPDWPGVTIPSWAITASTPDGLGATRFRSVWLPLPSNCSTGWAPSSTKRRVRS